MFWGAFHEHFLSRCWEGLFPVLKKALLTGHSMCYYWTKSPQSKISADVSSIYGPGKYSFLLHLPIFQFNSVTQSCLTFCKTPWTAALQASLSITNSQSLLKLMSIKLVMPSNHLILCRPLLLLPSIFPSIRVFSCESAVRIRWPKYWSFSFSVSPSNEYSGLVSLRMDWLALLAVQGTVVAVG